MNRNRFALLTLLAVALSLSSCHGLPLPGGGGGGGGGNGTSTVSFTLVADTPPVTPSLISFKVSVAGVTLTPTTGTAVTFQPASPVVVDLMRLQSDTALLGTVTGVPSGTYTAQVSLSAVDITFFNNTAGAITVGGASCAVNTVCSASVAALGNPTANSFSFTASSGAKQGIEFDFNITNALSISGGALSVNFNPTITSVFTAFNLPRTPNNLSANQFSVLEDFVGVVSVSGSTVTVTSPVRGTLAATNTTGSFFDPSPDGTLCPSPATFASCVANGQIASIDAFLNSDGTISLKEFEPLVATQKDFVEGTVFAIGSPTQFSIAVTDKVQAASNSLISSLNTGDLLVVNLPVSVSPFSVDTKGLIVNSTDPGTFGDFAQHTDTSAIHLGQSIALHISAFTAASGNTPASSTADTVTLRWSRFTATPATPFTTTLFNITGFPDVFNVAGVAEVETFPGSNGDGTTVFDGITDPTGLVTTKPVALRALFIEDPSLSANPPFFAAKVRQH